MQFLENYITLVNDGLNKFIIESKNEPHQLYDPVEYILSLGGKKIRPAIVLFSADLFGGKAMDVIHPAIAVEVFHNFTLVHDDIMDNAPLRRSQKTVHEKWNTNAAILSGDVMLVLAYKLLNEYKGVNKEKIVNAFNVNAIKVCEGQQMDMNFETQKKVTIADYLKMIEYKTAVLLAAVFKIGALSANANEADCENSYEFGKNLGMAFQLKDDLMDVYGTQNFGKQVGGDIISNKKTFMLLKSIELADAYKKEELLNWLQADSKHAEEKVNAVKQIYDALNIREITSGEMEKFYNQSLVSLTKLNISNEKKSQLRQLADLIMNREN